MRWRFDAELVAVVRVSLIVVVDPLKENALVLLLIVMGSISGLEEEPALRTLEVAKPGFAFGCRSRGGRFGFISGPTILVAVRPLTADCWDCSPSRACWLTLTWLIKTNWPVTGEPVK